MLVGWEVNSGYLCIISLFKDSYRMLVNMSWSNTLIFSYIPQDRKDYVCSQPTKTIHNLIISLSWLKVSRSDIIASIHILSKQLIALLQVNHPKSHELPPGDDNEEG